MRTRGGRCLAVGVALVLVLSACAAGAGEEDEQGLPPAVEDRGGIAGDDDVPTPLPAGPGPALEIDRRALSGPGASVFSSPVPSRSTAAEPVGLVRPLPVLRRIALPTLRRPVTSTVSHRPRVRTWPRPS